MRLKPLFLLCLLPATQAPAAIILVDEDFSSGDTAQLQYYGFSAFNPTFTAGRLTLACEAKARYGTSTFARTNLNVGDSLVLKFDIHGVRREPNNTLDNLKVSYLPIPEPTALAYTLPLLALLRRPIKASSSSLRDDTLNCR